MPWLCTVLTFQVVLASCVLTKNCSDVLNIVEDFADRLYWVATNRSKI